MKDRVNSSFLAQVSHTLVTITTRTMPRSGANASTALNCAMRREHIAPGSGRRTVWNCPELPYVEDGVKCRETLLSTHAMCGKRKAEAGHCTVNVRMAIIAWDCASPRDRIREAKAALARPRARTGGQRLRPDHRVRPLCRRRIPLARGGVETGTLPGGRPQPSGSQLPAPG